MQMKSFDIVVIGGGPGGYVAAIRASQLGKSVAVIEREHLGGICLNWGCIPTKALLRAAEMRHNLAHMSDFGLKLSKVKVNLEKVVSRSRKVAARLSSGVAHLLKKNKVTVIGGSARLGGKSGRLGGGNIWQDSQKTDSQIIQSAHVILATGARARQIRVWKRWQKYPVL